jgi:hypothetical protein
MMATPEPTRNRRDDSGEQLVRAFLEQAAPVILESRTLDGARLDEVLALADQIGLSRDQVASELRWLEQRGVIRAAPWDRLEPPEGAPSDAPPDSADALPPAPRAAAKPAPVSPPPAPTVRTTPPPPTPSPLPSQPTPSESFRRWTQQKLTGYPSAVLAIEDEQGLVGVGMHRFHLASVLASHIVRDVTTDQRIRLERDLDDASCHSTVAASGQVSADDQRLREFFEQAAPILAQHRGINAQSRVLISALARQLGLSSDDLDHAIASLQRAYGGQEENDPRQIERRDSFRRYLHRALAQVPHGIVTFRTHRRLIEAGEHFHGVAPALIQPTINEVASEMGVRFISEQQSVEHLSNLIRDVLDQQPVISGPTRSRIYAEGTRWGLDPVAIEAILRRHVESVRRAAMAERKRSRWILRLSVAVIAGLTLFLAWILVPVPKLSEVASPPGPTAEPPGPKRAPGTEWWDDALRIAIAQARRAHPDLREDLERIGSSQTWVREQASARLIEQWSNRTHSSDRRHPDPLRDVLVGLYVHEPSETLARQWPPLLLNGALPADQELPLEPPSIAALFRVCRTVAAMLADPALSETRAAELTALLETVFQQRIERTADRERVEQQCVEALVRRYYERLVRGVDQDPALVLAAYRALSAAMDPRRASDFLNRLDLDLLIALLPAAPDQWQEFEPALRRAAVSTDAADVIKLLNLYRDVSDASLRAALAELLRTRLGAAADSLSEPEVIAAVRDSLGVTARERQLEDWAGVADESETVLRGAGEGSTAPDRVLRRTIHLAHLATLACALAQGPAGRDLFEARRAAGPPALETATEGTRPAEAAKPFVAPYPVPAGNLLARFIGELASSKRPQQRAQLTQMIANQVDSLPDIDPELAGRLAEYLLQPKAPEEQQAIRPLMVKLARWPGVRLGWADYLAHVSGPDPRLEQLLADALGRPVKLSSETDRAELRRALLNSVLSELPDSPLPDDAGNPVFDQASRVLGELYAAQAAVLAAPLEGTPEGHPPSTILRSMITFLAQQAPPATVSDAERRFLDDLSDQLAVADFTAENDLQYTVLLGHIWARLLAIHVIRQHPEKTNAAREVVLDLERAVTGADNVLDQLRDVHAGGLRLWLLFQPPSSAGDFSMNHTPDCSPSCGFAAFVVRAYTTAYTTLERSFPCDGVRRCVDWSVSRSCSPPGMRPPSWCS